MRRIPSSIIFMVLISAAWGAAVFMLYRLFSTAIPTGLYYPLILSGAAAASGLFRGVPVGRAAFAGFASGFVYTLLSFTFPLLGAVLSGACLGGGIASGGKPGIFLQALKGAIIFPFFVVGGVYVGSLGIYTGPFLSALFWASWLGLAAGVITTPFLKWCVRNGRDDIDEQVREFSGEARGIDADLRELCEKMR